MSAKVLRGLILEILTIEILSTHRESHNNVDYTMHYTNNVDLVNSR
jgi:hypothetical protein